MRAAEEPNSETKDGGEPLPAGVPSAASGPEAWFAPPTPPAFEPPKYLASLIASINDGAKAAQTGAWFFLGVGLYLLAISVSTSDEDLFRNKTIAISQLGVGINPFVSFAIAPLIFVFLHIYTLIRYDMLAANLKQFEAELTTIKDTRDQERCRHLLANVEFLRVHGTRPGTTLASLIFPLISWFILALFPLLVLTLVQLSALRYQDSGIIFLQRAALVIDVLLWAWFGTRLWRLRHPVEVGRWRARRPFAIRLLWLVPLLAFNLAYMGVPGPEAKTVGTKGERIDLSKSLTSVVNAYETLKKVQPVDLFLCMELKLFCRYLTVDNRLLVANTPPADVLRELKMNDRPDKLLSDLATVDGLDLRDRTLRFINLEKSRLYAAALTSADLQGANLENASLIGTNFQNVLLRDTNLRFAHFWCANLWDFDPKNSDLSGAQLQGVNLQSTKDAGLGGFVISMNGTQLQNAKLAYAQLQGAALSFAQMQGADLEHAQLLGADLSGADLQVASLGKAQLQGADLHGANLQGADLQNASLEGADLRGARLKGANLRGTYLWQAQFDKNTDISLTDLRDVSFIPPTENERREINELLDEIPGDRRNKAHKRVKEGLNPGKFPAIPNIFSTNSGFILCNDSICKKHEITYKNIIVHNYSIYASTLAQFMISIAKSDKYIFNTLVARITSWFVILHYTNHFYDLMPKSPDEIERLDILYPNLARLLLEAREQGTVELPDDIAEKLKPIAARATAVTPAQATTLTPPATTP